MAEVAVLDDGTTLITQRPSRYVLEHPTYGAWLKFLLSRDAAISYAEGGKQVIKTRDKQPSHLVEGQPRVKCIACGIPTCEFDMSKITIGGLVRMPTEEVTGVKEITQKVILRPVSKSGLGCVVCQVKFQAAVIATARENELRAALAAASGALEQAIGKLNKTDAHVPKACPRHPSMGGYCVCLKVKRVVKPEKGTSQLSPWIDVFDVANGFTVDKE